MESATAEQRPILSAQCRAGRALVKWSRDQLAKASRVALRTIIDFERDARAPRNATLDAIQRALEAASVVFVEENGGGPGVRLRAAGSAAPDAGWTARGVLDARGMADLAIDRAFERSGEAERRVRDRRRRALTEMPTDLAKGKPTKR